MQQRHPPAGGGGGLHLSVSSVGSEAMQRCSHCVLRRLPRPAFSILGRIGGDATNQHSHRAPAGCCFQYPRSDRRRCNQQGSLHSRTSEQTFSILGRIGGDATADAARFADADAGFQYPRSDRRRCNPAGVAAGGTAIDLSVSSVGSEAMQRHDPPGGKLFRRTFSILGRIGGDAT